MRRLFAFYCCRPHYFVGERGPRELVACSSSDGKCLVVDVEPTEKNKDVTKIGKDVYQSEGLAEVDAKRLCKEKPADQGHVQ